jgi:hypothetical protein
LLRSVPAVASNPGLFSTLATVLIALSAIALGSTATRWKHAEFHGIAWAVLVLWGLKLLFRDLPNGHALSVCGSLVVYGATLIQLSRKKRSSEPDSLAARA